MRRHTLIAVIAIWLSALVLTTAGCSTSNTSGGSPNTNGRGMYSGGSNATSGGGPGGNAGRGMMGGSGAGANNYASAGERIFVAGVGVDGQNIPRTAPRVSQGSLMMGGGGCGSCHGANGRGGTIRMMAGSAVKVPDVTYDALIKEGFTDATIGKAIRDGLDESGKPLETAMPRWQMSDADVAATITYLKDLSAR